MNQSLNILKIINSVVLDNSNVRELKQQNKKLMVQKMKLLHFTELKAKRNVTA